MASTELDIGCRNLWRMVYVAVLARRYKCDPERAEQEADKAVKYYRAKFEMKL